MDKIKLDEIIKLHSLFINGNPAGKRADLRGAHLNGIVIENLFVILSHTPIPFFK